MTISNAVRDRFGQFGGEHPKPLTGLLAKPVTPRLRRSETVRTSRLIMKNDGISTDAAGQFSHDAIAFDAVGEIGCRGIVVVEPEGVRISSAAVSEAGRFAMAEENASCTGTGGRNAGRMSGYGAGSFSSRSNKGSGSLSEVRKTPMKRSGRNLHHSRCSRFALSQRAGGDAPTSSFRRGGMLPRLIE